MKKKQVKSTPVTTVKNLKGERWAKIKGYGIINSYQVSDKGRVKSISKNGEERLLVQEKTVGHYLRVSLNNKSGKTIHHRVHRLVGKAFIPNKGRKPQINHKNGNGRDNSAKNLEWVTAKENMAHAIANGYMSGYIKKAISRIAKNGKVRRFESISQAAKESKTNTVSIKAVLDGSHKTAGGYRWTV